MKIVRCLCVGWQQPLQWVKVGPYGTAGREALHVGTSDFRGLVVLEERLLTFHLLSEGAGSKR